MDFLADEVDGLGVGNEGDAHPLGRWRFFITRRVIPAAAEFSTAITTAVLQRTASPVAIAARAAAVTTAVAGVGAPVVAAARVITAGRALA